MSSRVTLQETLELIYWLQTVHVFTFLIPACHSALYSCNNTVACS